MSVPLPGVGPPEFQTRMSRPPNASSVVVDRALEVLGMRHVAAYGERADSVCLALELVAPAGEHRHVRALGGERLRGREPEPRGGAADERRPAFQSEVHVGGTLAGRRPVPR